VSNHRTLPAPCRGFHTGKPARIYCSHLGHKSLSTHNRGSTAALSNSRTQGASRGKHPPSEPHELPRLPSTSSQSIRADQEQKDLELMAIKGWNRELPKGKTAGRYIDTSVAF